jgi:tRNA modification GTPase
MTFRDAVLRIRAQLEVAIDFVEDEVPVINVELLAREINEQATELESLAATYHRGRLVRSGATVVLIGPPNAGKSSLFNTLCEQDRAIVTARPGTTRDTLEATVDILGVPVNLVDTAGIRETEDEVEIEGIARTHRAVGSANLVVALLDPAAPKPTSIPGALQVISKADLASTKAQEGVLAVSSETRVGLDALKEAIVERLGAGRTPADSALVIGRQRHYAALMSASEALRTARHGLIHDAPPELCAVDVQEAMDRLSEIVGLTTIEDVLDVLFGAFCIGK